jgi:hypothetical protein
MGFSSGLDALPLATPRPRGQHPCYFPWDVLRSYQGGGGWLVERRGKGTGYGLVTYNNNSTANYSAKCNNNAKNNYA